MLSVLFFITNLKAQDSTRGTDHSIHLKTQFFQIKDKFNYGLVFNGLNLVIGYSLIKTLDEHTFSYTPDFAFGANYNKGIGVALHFKPVDLYYGFMINKNLSKLVTVGPYFAINYRWQMYSELQSGHMFWFTSLELGPKAVVKMPVKNYLFKITFCNSIAGWVARPSPATETYFYSLKFSDFINNAHTNLKFGSFNLFNHTDIEIEAISLFSKRLSFAYEFEYFGYYSNPEISYLVHSLNLRWIIGKLKEECK